MATVDQLVIEIKAETRKLKKGLDDVNRKLGKTEKTAKKTSNAMNKIGGAVAALGLLQLGNQVITTIRKFEDLEATLRAVTGSTEAAAKSFELVRAFTSRTVFQVDEVARAFITLKQAGITPTSEVLQDFGNFAAGMGKSIEQLAQAAFNATTGEMEMLKQFGVIARQQGDKITVTFDGVTKTIERSGESIIAFLREIGRESFGTAIDERFNTLSGAIANLNDAIDEFNVAIGEAGASQAVIALVKQLTRLVQASDVLAKSIGMVVENFARFATQIAGITADILEFFGATNQSNQDLKDLDKELQTLLPSTKKLSDFFSSDEKKQFALFEKLNDQMDKSKFKIQDLVENDFAALIAILNKTAEAKLAMEMETNPLNFGRFRGTGDQKHFVVSDAAKARRLEELKRELTMGMDIEEYKEEVSKFLAESKKLETGIIAMQRAVVASSERFTSNFVDSLLNGQSALQSFKDFAKDIVSQIITIFLQMAVINKILNAIFHKDGLGLGGEDFEKLPELAGGGTVQRGTPTLVGERGAEIFVPNTGGTIMNNMNSKNAMGGSPIIVNQSVNFSTGVVPTVRAEVQKMLPQISDVTKGAVLEAAVRGGSYRKGLMGRG